MLPASVAEAILFFENERPVEICRAAVRAYSVLRAVEHYHFGFLTPEISGLLEEYAWIRDQEPGRVLKQKRIMSWVIAREQRDSLCSRDTAEISGKAP